MSIYRDVSVLELFFLDLAGENRFANHSLVLDFDSMPGVGALLIPEDSGLSEEPLDDCICFIPLVLELLPPAGAKLTILNTVSIGSITDSSLHFISAVLVSPPPSTQLSLAFTGLLSV